MINSNISRRSLLYKLFYTTGGAITLPRLLTKFVYAQVLTKTKTPLRKQATASGVLYGAAAGYDQLTTDNQFTSHVCEECAILVPESELKWKALRPSADRFDFTLADWMLRFAKSQSMLFRGHTLVWHEALPGWFNSTVNADNVGHFMTDHIVTVVKHYAGKLHSWDVVNEAIFPPDGRPGGMRNSPWYQFLGPDYVEMAFKAASTADPKALLVLNQNYLEYDSDGADRFRADTLTLLKKLKRSGTPIHALGTQAHLLGGNITFNPDKYNKFLNDVASLGLKIFITELDVDDREFPDDTSARDRLVAQAYQNFLTPVLRNLSVVAVLTWGLSDKYTWLDYADPRTDKKPQRPLPLDSENRRKPAWHAISHAFENAPIRVDRGASPSISSVGSKKRLRMLQKSCDLR